MIILFLCACVCVVAAPIVFTTDGNIILSPRWRAHSLYLFVRIRAHYYVYTHTGGWYKYIMYFGLAVKLPPTQMHLLSLTGAVLTLFHHGHICIHLARTKCFLATSNLFVALSVTQSCSLAFYSKPKGLNNYNLFGGKRRLQISQLEKLPKFTPFDLLYTKGYDFYNIFNRKFTISLLVKCF
jgi:hypothetical protein